MRRIREYATACTASGRCALALGAARARGLHERRRRHRHSAAARTRTRSPSISRSATSSARFPKTRTTVTTRASVASRIRRRRRPLDARPRLAVVRRDQHHRAHRPAALGDVRDIEDLVRRHQGRVRDARPVDRGRRRGGPADLEHLGIRHRDRHAAPRHHLRHHRRGRPRRRAALPAGRPHRVLLDAPAAGARPSCSTRASRSSTPRTRTATSPRSCCT